MHNNEIKNGVVQTEQVMFEVMDIPIFALYFRRISAFVFPLDFFAFPASPGLEGSVDWGRLVRGGAKDGRKADAGVLEEFVDATACRN